MDFLRIEFDSWIDLELKDYLLSLKGVVSVNFYNDVSFLIEIEYDSKVINCRILKFEIVTFLKIYNVASMLSFDKHLKVKTKEYKILIEDLCCEFCYSGMIDDLFMIDGIGSADSTFRDGQSKSNVVISGQFDPSIVNYEDIVTLERKFNFHSSPS